jgi:methionyl-tRNA synthetase
MKGEDRRPEREACLYTMAESIRQLAHMLSPVMPEKSRQILAQLGLDPPPMDTEPAWPSTWGELPPGTEMPPAAPVFPRIDKKAIPSIRERLGVDQALADTDKAPPSRKEEPTDGLISIDHFSTVELRTAKVLTAERVARTDKLLQLTVDCGEDEPRPLVAGIAKSYAPADLVGKTIIVVANLKPARLRGIESRGMLLAATTDDLPRVLTVDGEIPPGIRVS